MVKKGIFLGIFLAFFLGSAIGQAAEGNRWQVLYEDKEFRQSLDTATFKSNLKDQADFYTADAWLKVERLKAKDSYAMFHMLFLLDKQTHKIRLKTLQLFEYEGDKVKSNTPLAEGQDAPPDSNAEKMCLEVYQYDQENNNR